MSRLRKTKRTPWMHFNQNIPYLPTDRVSNAEKCPKLWRLISNKLSVELAIITLSWLRSLADNSAGSATDPKLARLSLRLALVTGLRRSLSVSWLLPGMFSLPVRSAHVDRFLAEGTSTHWPKGTPNTGPGPGWPLDSRDLSEKNVNKTDKLTWFHAFTNRGRS